MTAMPPQDNQNIRCGLSGLTLSDNHAGGHYFGTLHSGVVVEDRHIRDASTAAEVHADHGSARQDTPAVQAEVGGEIAALEDWVVGDPAQVGDGPATIVSRNPSAGTNQPGLGLNPASQEGSESLVLVEEDRHIRDASTAAEVHVDHGSACQDAPAVQAEVGGGIAALEDWVVGDPAQVGDGPATIVSRNPSAGTNQPGLGLNPASQEGSESLSVGISSDNSYVPVPIGEGDVPIWDGNVILLLHDLLNILVTGEIRNPNSRLHCLSTMGDLLQVYNPRVETQRGFTTLLNLTPTLKAIATLTPLDLREAGTLFTIFDQSICEGLSSKSQRRILMTILEIDVRFADYLTATIRNELYPQVPQRAEADAFHERVIMREALMDFLEFPLFLTKFARSQVKTIDLSWIYCLYGLFSKRMRNQIEDQIAQLETDFEISRDFARFLCESARISRRDL